MYDAYRGYDFGEYGTWWHKSFKQNIDGLGVKEKLNVSRRLVSSSFRTSKPYYQKSK